MDGKNHKARFGLAVACAGNNNLGERTRETPKGIQNLVVGAPYDGTDHRGAIYIYLGTPEGISKSYAQVIFASEVDSNIRTFGWSLSAGTDLLVGAYESNKVVLLKSSPIIQMDSQIRFKKVDNSNIYDINDCRILDGSEVPCVEVELSVEYSGIGVPDTIGMTTIFTIEFTTIILFSI